MEKECLERIEKIKEGFLGSREIFISLGDSTRQNIIISLLESGKKKMRVGEIAKSTYLSRPAVSHHLKVLKESGLIDVKKEGTKNFYFIDTESKVWQKMQSLFTDINENIHHLKNM